MNSSAALLLIVAAVLQIVVAQQSRGLGLSLCLNIFGGGCETDNDPANNEETNPLLVLKNGFFDYNKTVVDAQNIAMDGFPKASKLVMNRPQDAFELTEGFIQGSKDLFYVSGMFLFNCLGKALALSNDEARPGLIESTQKMQFIALNIFDEMRIASSLAVQAKGVGGNASRQAIDAISSNIQAAFAPLFSEIQVSLKQATEAIEYAQSRSLTRQVANRNAEAGTQDSDALAAISELNKAAANSIRRGASESKVKQLSDALSRAIAEIAEIALTVKRNILTIQNLSSEADLAFAKNTFLQDSENAGKRLQKLFASICLEFSSLGANLSQKQIQSVFVALEHGDDEVTYGNKVAKRLILSAFSYEGNGRKLIVDAAAQIARYGRIAFYQRIFETAKMVFEALQNKL